MGALYFKHEITILEAGQRLSPDALGYTQGVERIDQPVVIGIDHFGIDHAVA